MIWRSAILNSFVMHGTAKVAKRILRSEENLGLVSFALGKVYYSKSVHHFGSFMRTFEFRSYNAGYNDADRSVPRIFDNCTSVTNQSETEAYMRSTPAFWHSSYKKIHQCTPKRSINANI